MLNPCPSTVRIATAADYQEIWRMFLQGHNESGLFKLTPAKVDWWLQRLLCPETLNPKDTGPRGAIGVIGTVGHLEGLCVLTIGEYWYSDDKHLEEFLVYVDPEYRASNHARTLVSWMKQQSDITGLPLLTGIIAKERTEAKCRLYRRMVPKVGEFFLYSGKGSGSILNSSAALA